MPHDLQGARQLFLHAVGQVPPEQWDAYLAEACGPDEELRRQVAHLLQVHREAGSFLERPAEGLAATGTSARGLEGETSALPPEAVGSTIGPYKLLELIGEGGMGTVWMAQQTEPVKRLVALKLIKAGLDSKHILARFEAERQALALMDHPNIARVLDAGRTDAGRPYFVMELVKGTAITRYCDEHRLTPKERLELFVPVCQAVQHAHQKGIIHRDLKPSNVLIALYDGRPVPKVIDFGIAKAAGQPLTEQTLVTGFGAVVGTLEYMSPEQAELNQLDIDTRSDIYALGVLLYELLTGTTPLEKKRLREAALLEVLRLIREEEPPRPSTRLSTTAEMPSIAAKRGLEPKRLTGLVRGELDWIAMKALEKDRTRRYETANSFAWDIERYLADEPVLACPPSPGYRLRKFARRNKGRLAVAALVLLLLASLGGVAGWAALQQAKQQAAQRAALEADIGRDLDEAKAFCREDRLREASALLDHAEGLAARGGADADISGRLAQVRKDVDMASRLEMIRLEGAAVKDAHFDGEGADLRYRQAFRAYGADLDQLEPDKAAARIEGSAIRPQLIAALDCWLFMYPHNHGRLLAVLARADADPWRQQLRAGFANKNLKVLRELAREANAPAQPPADAVLLGHALSGLGDRGLAVEFLRRAQQEHPSDFWLNEELGLWLTHLKSRRAAEAVGYLRAALALRPDSPGVLLNLGYALDQQGDLPAAVAAYRKAVAFQPDYAEAHANLGLTLRREGDPAGAIAAYRKAIALKPNDAETHTNVGNALSDQGDLPAAIAAYRRAIALKPKDARFHYNLGVALRTQGDLVGARAAFQKAIALDPDYAKAHAGLGVVLRRLGDLAGAIAAYRQAIALKPDDAKAYNNLAVALHDQGDLRGAIAAHEKAIALKPDFAEAYCNLGLLLQEQGEFAKGLEELRRGHEFGSKDPRWRYPSALWLRQCQRLLEKDVAETLKEAQRRAMPYER